MNTGLESLLVLVLLESEAKSMATPVQTTTLGKAEKGGKGMDWIFGLDSHLSGLMLLFVDRLGFSLTLLGPFPNRHWVREKNGCSWVGMSILFFLWFGR